jgi:hypothetical protein
VALLDAIPHRRTTWLLAAIVALAGQPRGAEVSVDDLVVRAVACRRTTYEGFGELRRCGAIAGWRRAGRSVRGRTAGWLVRIEPGHPVWAALGAGRRVGEGCR